MSGTSILLTDILIVFDRNLGVSVFKNLRGYDDPIDDAEWLLERNPMSQGFIIRPVSDGYRDGLWIGAYRQGLSRIVRHEVLYDEGAREIADLIKRYHYGEVGEREFMGRMNIEFIKGRIDSPIVHEFRYGRCPQDHYYYVCGEVDRVYNVLLERFGGRRIPLSCMADLVLEENKCSNATLCPLKVSNAFERIYNLNRALKIRRKGEIIFNDDGTVEVR